MYISKTSATALALAFSSFVSGYTLSNVTYASNNTAIQLLPACVQQTAAACPGAWWNYWDPRFTDGVAKISGDPRANWNFEAAYMAFTFKGSAFYLYQWVNSSVADMQQYLDTDKFHLLSIYDQHPELTGDLQLMMTWSAEGLDPLQDHTIGLQQIPNADRGDTFIIIDHLVVTQTTLEPSDIKKKKITTTTIVGAVIGALLGLTGLVLGCFVLRRWNLQREAKRFNRGRTSRYEWQGDLATPATIKLDPSSEIEASERIAREGREEEEREREKIKLTTLTETV